jgi:predicted adenine nucleotide alpha hydrolase (AANH) superfamily ATPase
MKTLMHACCGPCSIECIEDLRAQGIEPVGFWYNPNIHPFTEYRSRRDAFLGYAKSVGIETAVKDDYGLRQFVREISPHFDDRCGICYKLRMDETAKFAAENGYASFTTTLLISPYQNHELLCRTAEEAAKRHGVEFLYRDFRPSFRKGQSAARSLEIYMQKYCGCIFSEEERYNRPKTK